MTTVDIPTICARWRDPNARPLFKGKLIDDDGCRCAQGDILHLAGWSDDELRQADQAKVDRDVAKLLGISRTHAVLLRQVNDAEDGCPQDVLDAPEKVLGDQAHVLLAFWRYLDTLDYAGWQKVSAALDAALDAAGAATWDAAEDAAGAATWDAAEDAARAAARAAAGDAAEDAARAAAGDAARDAVGVAAWAPALAAALAAARAAAEIQGASRLSSFFFLPLFGFKTPADIP